MCGVFLLAILRPIVCLSIKQQLVSSILLYSCFVYERFSLFLCSSASDIPLPPLNKEEGSKKLDFLAHASSVAAAIYSIVAFFQFSFLVVAFALLRRGNGTRATSAQLARCARRRRRRHLAVFKRSLLILLVCVCFSFKSLSLGRFLAWSKSDFRVSEPYWLHKGPKIEKNRLEIRPEGAWNRNWDGLKSVFKKKRQSGKADCTGDFF